MTQFGREEETDTKKFQLRDPGGTRGRYRHKKFQLCDPGGKRGRDRDKKKFSYVTQVGREEETETKKNPVM